MALLLTERGYFFRYLSKKVNTIWIIFINFRRPQQTLRDTFDYEDEVPEFLREDKDEVEYYDDEISFNEPLDNFEK